MIRKLLMVTLSKLDEMFRIDQRLAAHGIGLRVGFEF